ncbi:MAG: family 78 glycoside hydrolase catalytic domain, partial [Candidatus Ornithomonoglobus sp.]
WEMNKAACRGPVTAALCIEAQCGNAKCEIEADETFKTYPSPITFDDLRMGCRYDARLETDNWCGVDFDDSSWKFVKKETVPMGEARLCKADSIAVTEVRLPIDVKHYDRLPFAYETNAPDSNPIEGCVRDNVYVFDFGVNAAGVTKLKINGKREQKIVIRHGEYNCGSNFSVNTTA